MRGGGEASSTQASEDRGGGGLGADRRLQTFVGVVDRAVVEVLTVEAGDSPVVVDAGDSPVHGGCLRVVACVVSPAVDRSPDDVVDLSGKENCQQRTEQASIGREHMDQVGSGYLGH